MAFDPYHTESVLQTVCCNKGTAESIELLVLPDTSNGVKIS